MEWNIEETDFYKEHKGEKTSEWWRIFNNMCLAICNWLYDNKIGNYSDRHALEQLCSVAILTTEDSKQFISEFPKVFSFYERYESELKEQMTTILRKLIGMKVWSN